MWTHRYDVTPPGTPILIGVGSPQTCVLECTELVKVKRKTVGTWILSKTEEQSNETKV